MDLTVGFVSQNVVIHSNFIKFRYSKNFYVFRGDGCPMNPKNEIFEENLRSCKIV